MSADRPNRLETLHLLRNGLDSIIAAVDDAIAGGGRQQSPPLLGAGTVFVNGLDKELQVVHVSAQDHLGVVDADFLVGVRTAYELQAAYGYELVPAKNEVGS